MFSNRPPKPSEYSGIYREITLNTGVTFLSKLNLFAEQCGSIPVSISVSACLFLLMTKEAGSKFLTTVFSFPPV